MTTPLKQTIIESKLQSASLKQQVEKNERDLNEANGKIRKLEGRDKQIEQMHNEISQLEQHITMEMEKQRNTLTSFELQMEKADERQLAQNKFH